MVFPFKLVVLSWRWRRVTLCLVIPPADLEAGPCLNQNAFASSSSSSSSSFINGGCCGSSEPPEIVAASPSSAAFTGALGLAVSSVEVVARAEKVESRELFFIQRVSVRLKPSIRAGRFGDRGSGPWTSERASWKTPIEHFVFLVAPRPIFYGFARLITVVL
ncbi:BnaA09g26190D [Brassica napus]|uniref:BnaA09g26190D protein n=2 Tax=Brassica TaxID=3705 RepID=A0A078GNQ2_BRANA|nr:BnaA09g26190D [Brassica napus]